MNRSKGFSTIELAIVLVLLSLLVGAFVGSFSMYRDRAAFYGGSRHDELAELISIDKRTDRAPVTEDELVPDTIDNPAPTADVEEEITPEMEEDLSPWVLKWRKWLAGWSNWWS